MTAPTQSDRELAVRDLEHEGKPPEAARRLINSMEPEAIIERAERQHQRAALMLRYWN